MFDPKKIKIVVFDCDGVLFDTKNANKAYYNRMLAHFGKPPMTPEQFHYVHQHTVFDSIAHIFPDENMMQEALSLRKMLTYNDFIKDMDMEPTLIPLLETLRPSYKTGIATNRSDTMDRVLKEHQIENYFDMVVTASDVAHAKPAPDQLFSLLDAFSMTHGQMIYIGDSKLDELAAKAADVPFAAFQNAELEADFHIERLEEIKRILEI